VKKKLILIYLLHDLYQPFTNIKAREVYKTQAMCFGYKNT